MKLGQRCGCTLNATLATTLFVTATAASEDDIEDGDGLGI
jgi:hypothetical protein